jgi:hypothetical protein
MSSNFDTVWLSAMLLGGGGYLAVQGLRVALRRRIDNPLLQLEGGKALGAGLAICLIGLAAVVYSARELLALRGGG